MAWIDEFRTKLDPRARDTRIAFYEAADRWTADLDPRLQDLVVLGHEVGGGGLGLT
jgi:hypothetical protein